MSNFFDKYINLVKANNLQEAIAIYADPIGKFYINIPEEKANYSYAPNKWNLKDILQHVIDTERIMSYRMLCIARNDKNSLPGFEEKDYAYEANASSRTFSSLKEEFATLRLSTSQMIHSFTEDQLDKIGTMNGLTTKASAIGFVIHGHLLHHQQVIIEKYL